MTSRFSLVEDVALDEETEQVRMMADMAQIVAHRIRGLVTTIEGFTDLLADTLGGRDQRDLALRIFESAARIESVLADLQMFARPVQAVLSTTSVDAVLSDLYAAADEGILDRLEMTMESGEILLRLDRMLIRQALLVLVQNAADATSDDERVGVEVEMASDEVRFHVWNPGVLHPDVEMNAFKPFYTTKAHNLGVGLPIASRIARAHGGSLRLSRSDSAVGTYFTLSLPVYRAGEVEQ